MVVSISVSRMRRLSSCATAAGAIETRNAVTTQTNAVTTETNAVATDETVGATFLATTRLPGGFIGSRNTSAHLQCKDRVIGGRRLGPVLILAGLLAGCGGTAGILDTAPRTVPDNYGLVVTDEPAASAAGREVLAAGGNAIDAGIAAYFALAVTLPGSAGLAGGGVCLAHDGAATTVEALDFSVGPPTAGGFGAPGNLRGMFALHARYGRLRWEQA
ncbi:MAG: hypothetical protein FJX67_17560, partial [Alphaproteobacteria bacterium]|nr:hypothetical protein [Alphaproteobacteria bacterium]